MGLDFGCWSGYRSEVNKPVVESAADVWARVLATQTRGVNPPGEYTTYVGEMGEVVRVRNLAPRNVTTADGLTGKEIYKRYLDNMREAVHPVGHPLAGSERRWNLTQAQKTLGQLMWSVELKKKQTEQKAADSAREVSVVMEFDE